MYFKQNLPMAALDERKTKQKQSTIFMQVAAGYTLSN